MRLETERIVLEVEEEHGTICRLGSRLTGWELLRRRELALSWKLLLPLGERRRNHWVLGEKQRLTERKVEDSLIRLMWSGVESEGAGCLDITVTMELRVEAGRILVDTAVENWSPYVVESVLAPVIGEVAIPEGAAYLKGLLPKYNDICEWDMYPSYQNIPGCYSVENPTQVSAWSGNRINPSTPFFLVHTEREGLFLGVDQPCTTLVSFTTELYPGHRSGLDSRVPKEQEIAGKPVSIRLNPIHMPYIQPGDTAHLATLGIDAYVGDWQDGAALYQTRTGSKIQPCKAPDWARELHSWQQIQMNSPEDELRFRYTELPEVAKECAGHGIRAIQLVGWNWGGQDRGNPYHGVDPELGTEEELREAIRACQELGVQVILFAKFIWADWGSDWYREKLRKLAIEDPKGGIYAHPGFPYFTPTQLLNINPTRFAAMCFGSREYRELCAREFRRMLALGCDGILIDQCLDHGEALLCFNTDHGHRYGDEAYGYDCTMLEEFKALPEYPGDLLFAGEGCYDLLLRQYNVVYTRSFTKDHIPLTRYLFPRVEIMAAVTGFNDRNQINQCLMDRYIISYEPFYFKGRLRDFPDTVAYGKTIDAFRRRYRKWLWDGTFRGTKGAEVTADSEFVKYSVFQAEDGTEAVVLVNFSQDGPVEVTVRSEQLLLYAADPESGAESAFSGTISLKAESAAVLLPEAARQSREECIKG